MNCPGCTFSRYPPCAIFNIISASSLKDIILGNKLKSTPFPVCHKNAQKINNNKIAQTEGCDHCFLCSYLCVNSTNKTAPSVILEKLLFSELSRLNMYLQTAIPSAVVGSEIKAKGNAREKRIDVVIKKNRTIYLIKVLSDLNKLPFYSRSYNDLLEFYNQAFQDFTFYTRILIPAKHANAVGTSFLDCCTIEALIEEIQEA